MISYSSISLSNILINDGFSPPDHLYWLTPYIVVPKGYTGRVPPLGILVGKSVNGATPDTWHQVLDPPHAL